MRKVTSPAFLRMCKPYDEIFQQKKSKAPSHYWLYEVWSVYQIRNTSNDKRYVGITSLPPSLRWKQHIAASEKGRDLPLYCAIREDGIDQFVFAVIAWCKSEQEARHIEASNIQSQGTLAPDGYNARPEYFRLPRSQEGQLVLWDTYVVDTKRGPKPKSQEAAS